MILLAYVAMVIARDQRRARDAAIRLSTVDSLTGLFNRAFFFAAIEREIARSARSGRGFCLLMMDLDELKAINDRLGHFHGDRVLRGVGEVITAGVRQIDTAARYGGDEFVVLLPETDPTGAFVLAEKIRLGVGDMAVELPDGVPRPSLSIGVVSYPGRRHDRGRADDQRRRRDVRLEAGRQGPRDGRRRPPAGRRPPRHVRCSIPRVSDTATRRPPTSAGASRPAPSGRRRARRAVDQTPTSVPIYQTATFAAADADELGGVAGRPPGRLRLQPDLEPDDARPRRRAYAELAGGEAGVALASGMGAIHAALASLRPRRRPDRRAGRDRTARPGRSSTGDVRRLRGARSTSSTRPTSTRSAAALAAAPTRVLYAETIANPTTIVADHAALAELAHRHGATYVVDNTFASPYVCRPLDFGADLVVESATKFLGGHSDVIAGVVAGSSRARSPASSASRSIPARRSVRSRRSSSCAGS